MLQWVYDQDASVTQVKCTNDMEHAYIAATGLTPHVQVWQSPWQKEERTPSLTVTGEVHPTLGESHQRPIKFMAVHETKMVTCDGALGGDIKIWDLITNTLLGKHDASTDKQAVTVSCLDFDGDNIVCGTMEGHFLMWKYSRNACRYVRPFGLTLRAEHVPMSKVFLVPANSEYKHKKKFAVAIHFNASGFANGAAFSGDRPVCVWDVTSGTLLHRWKLKLMPPITHAHMCGDRISLLHSGKETVFHERKPLTVDAKDCTFIHLFKVFHGADHHKPANVQRGKGSCLHSNAQQVACGFEDGTVFVWDGQPGGTLWRSDISESTGAVSSITLLANNTVVYTTLGGFVMIRNTQDGSALRFVSVDMPLLSLTVVPSSEQSDTKDKEGVSLVVGSSTGTVVALKDANFKEGASEKLLSSLQQREHTTPTKATLSFTTGAENGLVNSDQKIFDEWFGTEAYERERAVQAFLKAKKMGVKVVPSKDIDCDLCDASKASIWCEHCKQYYCANCSDGYHAPQKFQHHYRSTLKLDPLSAAKQAKPTEQPEVKAAVKPVLAVKSQSVTALSGPTIPVFKWAQDEVSLVILIQLPGVEANEHKLTEAGFHFATQLNKVDYALSFSFRHAIDPSMSSVKVLPKVVQAIFRKDVTKCRHWKHLLTDADKAVLKGKCKVNWDLWTSQDEEEEKKQREKLAKERQNRLTQYNNYKETLIQREKSEVIAKEMFDKLQAQVDDQLAEKKAADAATEINRLQASLRAQVVADNDALLKSSGAVGIHDDSDSYDSDEEGIDELLGF